MVKAIKYFNPSRHVYMEQLQKTTLHILTE